MIESFKKLRISGKIAELTNLDLVNSIINRISIETEIIEITTIELLNSWFSASISRLFVKS
jgi:hypothetical protein